MEIYDRIKSLRESMRYSQYDMADKLNISQTAYLQIEKGKTELSVSRLRQIASVFGVSEIHLLGVEPVIGNGEDQDKVELIKKRLVELEELAESCRASERKYADFVGVLFHRIDWAMLVVAYENGVLSDKELGSYLVKEVIEGNKTVNIKIERVHTFPNYESYTSKLMSQEQIYETLPKLSLDYSHDYQTLIKLYQRGLLPDDKFRKALDNRFTDEYWRLN